MALPARFPSDMPIALQRELAFDLAAFGRCAWRRREDGSYEVVKPQQQPAAAAKAGRSLLRPATVAPVPPLKIELRPVIRYANGRSRPATADEWEKFKEQWGRPAAKL